MGTRLGVEGTLDPSGSVAYSHNYYQYGNGCRQRGYDGCSDRRVLLQLPYLGVGDLDAPALAVKVQGEVLWLNNLNVTAELLASTHLHHDVLADTQSHHDSPSLLNIGLARGAIGELSKPEASHLIIAGC